MGVGYRLWAGYGVIKISKLERNHMVSNYLSGADVFPIVSRLNSTITGGAFEGGLIVSNASNAPPAPRLARLGIFVTTGVTLAFVTEHPLFAVPAHSYAIPGGCRARSKPGSVSRRRAFLVASARQRYAQRLLLMSR